MRSAAGRVHRARPRQLPRVLAGLLVLALASLACTGQGSPATTPATTPPEPSSTNTLRDTTTTIDRAVEVEAILLELEERRLDALYREDLEALRAVFSSQALYERTVPIVGELDFQDPPWRTEVRVLEVLVDREDCLVVQAEFDARGALGREAIGQETVVLTRTEQGSWGFAYSGTGWLCEGPNPLELEG